MKRVFSDMIYPSLYPWFSAPVSTYGLVPAPLASFMPQPLRQRALQAMEQSLPRPDLPR